MKLYKTGIVVALFTVLLMSCNTGNQNHVHDHGPEPVAYTRYSDYVEIFVEYKPLVVGSPSKFAAHFTLLGETFLPLSEGSVTVSLIVGEKGIRHQADTPAVPGIYRLALMPVVAGQGKLVFDIVTKSFTDQIVIDPVSVYNNEASALADQPEDNGGSDITYLKEQAWKVTFANMPVRKQPFSEVIKTNGQILSAPGDEIVIASTARGMIRFAGTNTIVGSEVKAGAILFTVSGGNLTEGNVDALYKELKAKHEKAKADFERASVLVKDKIVSQKDFLELKLQYENAQTAFNSVAKNYSDNGQTISSEITGFIKNIFVIDGQYVIAGTPLAAVSKNKVLLLQANVSQKDYHKLSSVTSAHFKTTGSDTFMSTTGLNGRIITYGKSSLSNSPYIPVTFEIDNPGELVPGSIAEVFLKTAPVQNALVVPVSSLIEEQGSYYIYVQTGGESFQKREVKPGETDGINIRLLSGANENERVVTKGAYQIKLSQASGAIPAHGHEH